MTFKVTIMFGLRSMFFWQPFWILLGYIYHDRLIGVFIIIFGNHIELEFLDCDFLVGLMLYHSLRCWPNIKTTLRRRFVQDVITTLSPILKCSL